MWLGFPVDLSLIVSFANSVRYGTYPPLKNGLVNLVILCIPNTRAVLLSFRSNSACHFCKIALNRLLIYLAVRMGPLILHDGAITHN